MLSWAAATAFVLAFALFLVSHARPRVNAASVAVPIATRSSPSVIEPLTDSEKNHAS